MPNVYTGGGAAEDHRHVDLLTAISYLIPVLCLLLNPYTQFKRSREEVKEEGIYFWS